MGKFHGNMRVDDIVSPSERNRERLYPVQKCWHVQRRCGAMSAQHSDQIWIGCPLGAFLSIGAQESPHEAEMAIKAYLAAADSRCVRGWWMKKAAASFARLTVVRFDQRTLTYAAPKTVNPFA